MHTFLNKLPIYDSCVFIFFNKVIKNLFNNSQDHESKEVPMYLQYYLGILTLQENE